VQDLQKLDYITQSSFDLQLETVDLRLLMQRIVDVFAQQMKEKDLSFALEISQVEHHMVLCDGARLSRLLLNLISNSYKFTPSGGRIVVMLTEKENTVSPSEQLKPRLAENEAEFELRVQDTGIGMSESYAKEIFEEKDSKNIFYEEEKKTQGMLISKYLVDLMGGTIKVISAPEEGTEFIINLVFTITPKATLVVEN
jgi:signal transduction histidine kinase